MRSISLFFFLLFILSCELPETPRGSNAQTDQELPDQTSKNVDVVYSEEGVIKMRLRAPYLIMKDTVGNQYNEFPNGVNIDFYDEQGQKNGDLVSDFGVDNPGDRERYAKGNVVINFKNGWIYETDELYIDEKKDSVHNAGKPVKITKQDGTILQGDSFRSNSHLDFIEIKNLFDSAVPIEENQVNSSPEVEQIPSARQE